MTRKKPGPKPIARDKVADYGIDAIIDRIEDGKTLSHVAKEIGVSRWTVQAWIDADPERSARVRTAVLAGAEGCDEKAEAVLASLQSDATQADIARARELASHYRWRARVRNPVTYGDKQQIDITHRYAELSDAELDAELARLESD